MMCRYIINYTISGIPLFKYHEWRTQDRIVEYTCRRSEYDYRDYVHVPEFSGYTFPLEYKGPLFEFVVCIRRILFANEMHWSIKDIDEKVLQKLGSIINVIVPHTRWRK